MRSFFITLGQIVFFIIVSQAMNALAHALHLPIPGSIFGIVLIFALLQTKVIPLSWVDLGAKWLLAEMLLFFIPSAVGMVQYKSLLLSNGVRIITVMLCSTITVMICAGIVAQKLAKRKERKLG